MTDNQHPKLLLLHRFQQHLPDLGLTDRIQHGRDLIGNEKGGLRAQGPGNGQALQFAAREFMGIAVEPAGFDAQLLKQRWFGLKRLGQGAAQLPAGIKALLRVLIDQLNRQKALASNRFSVDPNLSALGRQMTAKNLGRMGVST
ncbi:MAG: hypothetical protein V2I50_02170 [Desulfuromusa sp.]|nr:hypothetical protein [Desulfuromusa sp.]